MPSSRLSARNSGPSETPGNPNERRAERFRLRRRSRPATSLMICALSFGSVVADSGSISCGMVLSSLVWRYLSYEIGARAIGRMDRCRASNPSPAAEEPVGPVDLDQCAHIFSELLSSHESCTCPDLLAERALVAEWIACAGDIGEAYVSGRRDDDPALRNRVVIVTRPEDGPTHLVHAPARRGIWIVLSLGNRTKIQRFQYPSGCIELRSTSPCEGWIEKILSVCLGRNSCRS